jgi:hypothetical protein
MKRNGQAMQAAEAWRQLARSSRLNSRCSGGHRGSGNDRTVNLGNIWATGSSNKLRATKAVEATKTTETLRGDSLSNLSS